MSTDIVLSRAAFDLILANLVRLEERTEEILQQFFPTPSRERAETIRLIDQYLTELERILGSVAVRDGASSEFPYAVIGAQVTLQELSGPELFTHRLINPLDEQVDFADVSFLSPMGRAMLLKRRGDRVTVAAPGGVYAYQICSVTMAAERTPQPEQVRA
ncbi:MAG: GreA/GreB family elongation factor [Chitinophagales bacterium]